MICLQDLIEAVECNLPMGAAQKQARQVVQFNQPEVPIQLREVPLPGTVQMVSADMETMYEPGVDYRVNYLTGTLTLLSQSELPCPIQLLVSYGSSTTRNWLEMAIADLGVKCPQKRTAQLPVSSRRVRLPQSVKEVLGLGLGNLCALEKVDGNCRVQCGPCQMYIDGGYLCTDRLPDSGWVEICYMGGFVANCDGCYPNLTPEFSDLVVYKALSLAYASPMTAAALTGRNAGGLATPLGVNAEKPAGPVIARDERIGDESVSVRWADSRSGANDPFSASSLRKSAEYYERLYKEGIAAWADQPVTLSSGYCEGAKVPSGRYLTDRYIC